MYNTMLDGTSRSVKFRARRAKVVRPPEPELLPATSRAKRCIREHRFLESGTSSLGMRGLIVQLK